MYWALHIRSAQETGWLIQTHSLMCDRYWLITRLCWQRCKHNRRCWGRRQLSVRSNWRALSWIGQRPMQRRHLPGRLCSDCKQSSRTRKKLHLSHFPPLLIWTRRCCPVRVTLCQIEALLMIHKTNCPYVCRDLPQIIDYIRVKADIGDLEKKAIDWQRKIEIAGKALGLQHLQRHYLWAHWHNDRLVSLLVLVVQRWTRPERRRSTVP